MKKLQTVDEYISALPDPARDALIGLREAIRQAAPQADEVISYNMPAYRWKGMLVWFAAFKTHIGFYPKPSAIAAFKRQLEPYKLPKAQFNSPSGSPFRFAWSSRL